MVDLWTDSYFLDMFASQRHCSSPHPTSGVWIRQERIHSARNAGNQTRPPKKVKQEIQPVFIPAKLSVSLDALKDCLTWWYIYSYICQMAYWIILRTHSLSFKVFTYMIAACIIENLCQSQWCILLYKSNGRRYYYNAFWQRCRTHSQTWSHVH